VGVVSLDRRSQYRSDSRAAEVVGSVMTSRSQDAVELNRPIEVLKRQTLTSLSNNPTTEETTAAGRTSDM
jgi:hypothetical protein